MRLHFTALLLLFCLKLFSQENAVVDSAFKIVVEQIEGILKSPTVGEVSDTILIIREPFFYKTEDFEMLEIGGYTMMYVSEYRTKGLFEKTTKDFLAIKTRRVIVNNNEFGVEFSLVIEQAPGKAIQLIQNYLLWFKYDCKTSNWKFERGE